ncbi:MAG: hypothetical protein ABIF88_00705 [archaeon]
MGCGEVCGKIKVSDDSFDKERFRELWNNRESCSHPHYRLTYYFKTVEDDGNRRIEHRYVCRNCGYEGVKRN